MTFLFDTVKELNSTRKRRARRQRAKARLQWFLYKKGYTQLSNKNLLRIKLTLSRHHSKDKKFLATINSKMTTPWKCHYCRRLCKASAGWCGSCGGSWEQCHDEQFTYAHPQSSARTTSPRRPTWTQWDWSQAWPQNQRWPTSKSPRRGGKGKSKGQSEGKAGSTDPLAPPWLQSATPPTSPTTWTPQLPLPPPSSDTWTTTSSPFMQAPTSSTTLHQDRAPEDPAVRHLLKSLRQSSSTLPDDLRKGLSGKSAQAVQTTTQPVVYIAKTAGQCDLCRTKFPCKLDQVCFRLRSTMGAPHQIIRRRNAESGTGQTCSQGKNPRFKEATSRDTLSHYGDRSRTGHAGDAGRGREIYDGCKFRRVANARERTGQETPHSYDDTYRQHQTDLPRERERERSRSVRREEDKADNDAPDVMDLTKTADPH